MAGQLDLFPIEDIIGSDKEKKTLIKETIIREYETYDEDGDRRIKKETEVKRWFQYDPISLKQNPTQSITYEVL
jgi:hypothetical protein